MIDHCHHSKSKALFTLPRSTAEDNLPLFSSASLKDREVSHYCILLSPLLSFFKGNFLKQSDNFFLSNFCLALFSLFYYILSIPYPTTTVFNPMPFLALT